MHCWLIHVALVSVHPLGIFNTWKLFNICIFFVFPQSFSRRWSRRWTAPKSCASTSSKIPGISLAVFKRWRKPLLNSWTVSLFLTSVHVQFSWFRRRRQHTWNCAYSPASSSYLLESVIAPRRRLFQTVSSADECMKPCKLDNRRAFSPSPAPFIYGNKWFCDCWRAAWTHVYTLTNAQAEDHMTLPGKVSWWSQPTKSK